MRLRWWLPWFIPAFLLGHYKLVPTLLWYAGIIVVCYAFSLALHSNRRCRACGGSGRQKGAMFWWGDRMCTTCGGQSRHRRWGVQMFYRESRTYSERATGRARGRRGRLR